MPITTIEAIDREFATATGANINSKNGRSSFDAPLDRNSDLTITSNATDDSPYLFELGETYDLTWVHDGVMMTMTDAVVVRSDQYFDKASQGIVVFEGTDQNGDPAQVLWTQNLDVHTWYSSNFNGGNPPVFWNTDQGAATFGYICFAAEARVLTGTGPRAVSDLRPGDQVWSLDHGLVPLRWVARRRASGEGDGAPILFAPGSLGNSAALRLSPQHRVLLSGPAIEEHVGDAEVLVPAKALVGRPGVSRAPCAAVDYVHLLCDAHEVVLAEGAACETLLLGDEAAAVIAAGLDPGGYTAFGTLEGAGPSEGARPLLTVGETRRLLDAIGPGPLVLPRHEMDVPDFSGPPIGDEPSGGLSPWA